MNQDLAPKGGFAPIRFARNLPSRGPSAAFVLLGMTAITFYGFHHVRAAKAEMYELKREKTWARIHLLPLITAEQDRFLMKEIEERDRKEAEIMKDVKGWKVGKSPYHFDDVFFPPVYRFD